MILQVHIREPLKQLLPIIFPFLFCAFVSSLLQLASPFYIPPFVVHPSSIFHSALIVQPLFRCSFIPVFLRKLRFVVRFCSWTEVIMQFFFNGLFRRKPPLYSVQDPSRWTSIWRIFILPLCPVIPWQTTANSVIVHKSHWGWHKTSRWRGRLVGISVRVFLVFAFSL